ncbi:MAG TPA: Mur ligase family protein [Kiritimatiellia bacterium]|nr:Mur ligase family protein [Kiritimatiellia bacterium]
MKERLETWRNALVPRWRRFLFVALRYHHRFVRRSTVIAVTGSCGKTTAKELLYHVLSSKWRGTKAKGTRNGFYANALVLLRTIPLWHRFSVIEAGTDQPGKLDVLCRAYRPDVGVVLMVGLDHYRSFRNREAVAEEKKAVVAHLPESGLAVLNADDDLVLSMAQQTKAHVVTYGTSPGADIRAENISANWPERLAFDVIINGERSRVQTRLCGDMWLPSVLPVFAVARHMGVAVAEVIAAIETHEAHELRMDPREMPDGSTFLLDDWKSPFWSIDRAVDFISKAQAPQKILVLGTISDSPGGLSKRYAQVVRKALDHVDYVIITGSVADMFKTLHDKFDPARVRIVPDIRNVTACLDEIMMPGALVMLKGTNKQDHLSRLMHNRIRPVKCWSRDCRLQISCANCRHLFRGEP